MITRVLIVLDLTLTGLESASASRPRLFTVPLPSGLPSSGIQGALGMLHPSELADRRSCGAKCVCQARTFGEFAWSGSLLMAVALLLFSPHIAVGSETNVLLNGDVSPIESPLPYWFNSDFTVTYSPSRCRPCGAPAKPKIMGPLITLGACCLSLKPSTG